MNTTPSFTVSLRVCPPSAPFQVPLKFEASCAIAADAVMPNATSARNIDFFKGGLLSTEAYLWTLLFRFRGTSIAKLLHPSALRKQRSGDEKEAGAAGKCRGRRR